MKWKDTGDGKGANPEAGDPYYEDDGYASFKEEGYKKSGMLSGIPVRFLYWGAGIVAVLLLIALIGLAVKKPVDAARINAMEQRIEDLEEQLEKVDGVDEKVTRIWEQAKSFETFKARFDRSEASMSLRMDHLAMSLDALQKKTNETRLKLGSLEKASASRAASQGPKAVKKKRPDVDTHTVTAGETLYGISRRYNLTVEELLSKNKLSKDAIIHVGQKLVVK
jgi:hypothetical protein